LCGGVDGEISDFGGVQEMMEKMTYINPNMLKWARTELNMTTHDAQSKIHSKILDWENGTDFPSYAQLEKIAETYNRPLAIFFFSEPPILSSLKTSFRTLNDDIFKQIPSKILKLMDEARAMQLNLAELSENADIQSAKVVLAFLRSKSSKELLIATRSQLGVTLQMQKNKMLDKEAFELWRNAFERNGIYVFKGAFRDNSISGFCINDEDFPVIYVNNSMSFNRQIFTLFHELYHLIRETSGIDTIKDDYIDLLEPDNKKVEQLCNSFAGSFLLPQKDFSDAIQGKQISVEFISELSKHYNVSRQVVMVRLLNMQKITQKFYDEQSEHITQDYLRRKHNSKGGSHYNTLVSYLGNQYLHLVFSQFAKQKIDVFKLSEYTKTKVENLSTLEKSWGWRV